MSFWSRITGRDRKEEDKTQDLDASVAEEASHPDEDAPAQPAVPSESAHEPEAFTASSGGEAALATMPAQQEGLGLEAEATQATDGEGGSDGADGIEAQGDETEGGQDEGALAEESDSDARQSKADRRRSRKKKRRGKKRKAAQAADDAESLEESEAVELHEGSETSPEPSSDEEAAADSADVPDDEVHSEDEASADQASALQEGSADLGGALSEEGSEIFVDPSEPRLEDVQASVSSEVLSSEDWIPKDSPALEKVLSALREGQDEVAEEPASRQEKAWSDLDSRWRALRNGDA